jgi:hypothetical protein
MSLLISCIWSSRVSQIDLSCIWSTVILTDVGCWRLNWSAPTPPLAQSLQLQYWGVVSGHSQACSIVTLISYICIVVVPWSLLSRICHSWVQALHGIWMLCCFPRWFLGYTLYSLLYMIPNIDNDHLRSRNVPEKVIEIFPRHLSAEFLSLFLLFGK